jgi:hypothetical protein
MIDDTILDEMNLPWSSSNEDLETISNNFFKPLFDVARFEIRSETERDKGIDHQIELKRTSRYTNFRFAIQLKATDCKEKNKDGSISLQLDTGNINYLLNNPMPAFYVLYFKKTGEFYYESINDFAKSLYEKKENWNNQSSHIIRFSKELDSSGVDLMYQLTLEKGKFQRTINEKRVFQSISIKTDDKLLIDNNFNISGDTEIRTMIEKSGLHLINEGNWKDVLFLHKKASGNVASSALYNLVIGIANYYSGNLMEALSFFKSSNNLKSELTQDLQNHLKFFETTVKYSIGLLSEIDYNSIMDTLEGSENIRLYIKLEKAKQNFINSLNKNSNDRYKNYSRDVQSIINDPNANESIQLNAKSELVLFEGYQNNIDYIKGVSKLNYLEEQIGPNFKMRKESVLHFIKAKEKWYKNVQYLKQEALDSENYFAYFNALINEVKITFEFQVYTDLVFIIKEIPGIPAPVKPDSRLFFNELLEKITKAYNYYKQIGHIENTLASLSIKYEISHYNKDFEETDLIINELEDIIESYDLPEQRKKIEFLKNNGTTHEQFKCFLENIFKKTDSSKKDLELKRNEMIRMDEVERNIEKTSKKGLLQIHLFPIGYFQFPKEKKSLVYDILNISKIDKVNFDNMFAKFIPTANVFYNPITQEGYGEGKQAEKSIENWLNMYRIRKSFYENKFYKIEIK